MPEYCTCGAQLPEDARFCHKCGKPQREELALEQDAIETVPPPVAAPVPQVQAPSLTEINFRNIIAVRVGFLSAAIASLLTFLPIPLVLTLLWLAAAGFFSVWLYRRRTGVFLTVRNGARIGSITGVFSFVISTVLFTVSMITISLSGQTEGLATMLRDQLQQKGFPQEMVDQAIEVLMSPAGFTLAILFSLALRFVGFLGITAVGGALGARVLSKE